ncbi:MAG: valine--tRNA ligase [Parcubacteria group bacterium]|nr:valine--tRNA ligase [Parcubacteria group bacterium]
MNFDSPYNPKETEDKIYQLWEKSGFFNPDNLLKRKKRSFTIVVPPPNITGSLHMGHALNATIQDILIRKKRMEGYKTLWLPGTDHAGIATQNIVERELKKQGLPRHDLGREKFLEKIWEWKEKYGSIILEQFKKLGSSMDWSRTRFTMDADYQEAVKEAFLHYYKRGWIYRAKRVINWCPKDATSLSDLELGYKEEQTTLWHIKYPLAEKSKFIIVATTRPETMLGDTAIAVNPKDNRYKNLIGEEVILPIKNRKIPIIGDRAVDMNFGTGAVKVTPAHDITDAEIGNRHNLEFKEVIDSRGRMTAEAGKICEGLKTTEYRIKIIEELKSQNLIVKEEPYKHNVAVCYRCDSTIEPIPSLQWFLKMDKLAKIATQAVKSGKVKFHPKRWEKTYFSWLKNVRDWTISRQIWWGHKIPLDGENDILDTWFSSALWPFATLGWPKKTAGMKNFYPTNVLSTARDIINLWVSRMIFSGLEFTNKTPFSDVIIHGTILTKDGKRMSKSLGTGIDPILLIDKYGADALRFGLIWQSLGNQDIHWSEEHVLAGKKFCNKIWNATRFVLLNKPPQINADKLRRLTQKNKNLTAVDKKILNGLKKTTQEVNNLINKYEFGHALHKLYDFFWHEYADIYIETAKKQLADNKLKSSTQNILLKVHTDLLKLLHPFLPFITEEIWSAFNKKNLLLIENWPD